MSKVKKALLVFLAIAMLISLPSTSVVMANSDRVASTDTWDNTTDFSCLRGMPTVSCASGFGTSGCSGTVIWGCGSETGIYLIDVVCSLLPSSCVWSSDQLYVKGKCSICNKSNNNMGVHYCDELHRYTPHRRSICPI